MWVLVLELLKFLSAVSGFSLVLDRIGRPGGLIWYRSV